MSGEPGSVVASTRSGAVRGRVRAGVATYLGVPYASAPVGELRFAAPHPPLPWPGVRDALEPGPSAPQRGARRYGGLDVFAVTGAEWRRGDDYLTLNVWAPAGAAAGTAGTARPVMVWVHGGGLVLGTKDAAVHDGTAFARDGVVVVAVNYRLGVEGFVPVPGAPTNTGLRDLLAALAWVRDNAAAFGGDSREVTLFGESGGAMIVASLVSSPLAEGLVRRAIVQSGHGSSGLEPGVAHRVVERLAQLLDVTPDVDGFRSVGVQQTLHAYARASRPGALDLRGPDGTDPTFGLGGGAAMVLRDDVLPQHPVVALRGGAGRGIDLLVTTTSEEASFFLAPLRALGLPRPVARLLLGRVMADSGALMAAYRKHDDRARGGELLSRVLTDVAFRWPARQLAAAHRGRTHVAEFDWRSTAAGGRLGAAHGTDLAFVFDTLAAVTGPRGLAGEHPPQELADRVHGLWVRFAHGEPMPWPEHGSSERWVHHLWSGRSGPEPELPAAAFLAEPG